uniref:ATP-binding protein n=1 Tax=Aestuariivirga sp. TaxID=2650926 RepID=UPI0035B2C2D9
RLAEIKRRADAIDAQRLRLKEIVAGLAPLEQDMATVTASLGTATERKAALDAAADALDAEERNLARLADLSARLAERDGLAARLTQLETLHSRATANDAALRATRVDDAAVKALEKLEAEGAQLRGRLEAAAARVVIAAKTGSDVRVNGASVSGTAERSVTEPLVITVSSDVSITVSPPQAAAGTTENALAEQRERLKALLASCGATDAADLRRLRAERAALEEQARDLHAERKALAIKESVTDEIERLQAAIGEIDAVAQRSHADDTPLPAAAEIDRRRQQATERRSALRAERAGAESQLVAQREALAKLRERRATLQGQSEQIHAGLASELTLLPDEQRGTMLSEAATELETRRDAHRIKAALVAQMQAQAPEDGEIERLQARVERLTSAMKGQQEKLDLLRERIARLEGEVQVAGGDGLGERAAVLKLQQEMALAEEARIAERVEVLKLLRKTVDESYAERREQLNAPLRRHLRPFLHDVFPKAEIELGDNFAISRLARSGPAAELFGRLSLGTQEQIAVLVRLAMGAMICERGADVPIILDDALVFSDDDRIEQMFDAINRAGRNQQVIVLTCRSRSFTSLGGRQLQIV